MVEKNSPNIFLSSTYRDLKKEREVASKTITKNTYAILRMENWDSGPITSKEKIIEELNKASALILILGFKYGSIDEEEGISITEFEYESAKKLEIPIFVFVKKENGKWHNKEKSESKEKLDKFKYKLLNEKLKSDFNSLEELEKRISDSLNEYKSEIWENKDFTDKFFKEQFEISKNNLGKRYSPEINVDLKLDFFNVMAKNNTFKKKLDKEVITHYCNLKNITIQNKELEKQLTDNLNELKLEYENIFKDIEYNYDNLINKLKNITKILKKSDEYETNEIEEIIYQLNEFMDYLMSFPFKLQKNPVLFLSGVAGSGKSHLLADLASKRFENSEISILLLGSHFENNMKIDKQIINLLDLNLRPIDFLEKLNNKAKYKKSRIIIMIDALNECEDKQLWEKYLNAFVSEIKKYKWLGLIVSIRSTYLDLIPEDLLNENNHYELDDFKFKTFEAIEIFCNEYEIDYPSFPPIHKEFSNPLFLKLLFETLKKSGHTSIPQKLINFSDIITEFINNIDKTLHKHPIIPDGFNITMMFITEVIKKRIQNPQKLIYEDLFYISAEICKKLNISNFHLIDELIKEGLFYKDKIKEFEIISFTYEKLEDYLTAEYLLSDISTADELFDEFKENEKIQKIINDRGIQRYLGVFESLAIQLPEKFGVEIYEIDYTSLHDSKIIKNNLFEWFIQSLYWRKPETVTEKVYEYINKELEKSAEYKILLLETMISLSNIPNFPFNSEKLHEILLNKSLDKRDAFWLPWINDNYINKGAVCQTVNWALILDNENKIEEDSLKLLSLTLSWFLASNNDKLRDESTYALINILKNNLNVLIGILKTFENIDDDYISERLYAVAYACVLKSKDIPNIELLSEYIYNEIFLKEKTSINILLRDYARNILYYAKSLNLPIEIDLNVVNSRCLPDFSKEQLNYDDKLSETYINQDMPTNGEKLIIISMDPHFGSFGKNNFELKLYYWEKKINKENIKNLIIEESLKMYNTRLHSPFDMDLERNYNLKRNINTHRIGEKYQRIVFNKILATLADNYKINSSWTKNYEHYLLGPWEIGIRNFDPTLTTKNNMEKDNNMSDLINFESKNFEWSESIEDLPSINDIINQKNIFNEQDDWLLLFGQINANNSNKLTFKCKYDKGLYLDIYGLLVKTDEKEDIILKLKNENLKDILPTVESVHQVFDKEYCWSNAYNNLMIHDCFQELYYKNFKQRNDMHIPYDFNEWELDKHLKDKFIKNYIKPSKLLFKELKLEYGEKDNILYSSAGEKLIINLSDEERFEYRLLINKKAMISFLERNNLEIIWLVSGAKITYKNGNHDYDKKLNIQGIYYLNNGNSTGNLNC